MNDTTLDTVNRLRELGATIYGLTQDKVAFSPKAAALGLAEDATYHLSAELHAWSLTQNDLTHGVLLVPGTLGFLVFDIDTTSGADLIEAFLLLRDTFGEPVLVVPTTKEFGRHVYYWAEHHSLKEYPQKSWVWGDTRCGRGYVKLHKPDTPQAILNALDTHPDRSVSLEAFLAFVEAHPAAPKTLSESRAIDVHAVAEKGVVTLTGALTAIRDAEPGHRHPTACSWTMKLAAKGLLDAEAQKQIVDAYVEKNTDKPGSGKPDIEKLIEGALAKAKRKAKGKAKPKPADMENAPPHSHRTLALAFHETDEGKCWRYVEGADVWRRWTADGWRTTAVGPETALAPFCAENLHAWDPKLGWALVPVQGGSANTLRLTTFQFRKLDAVVSDIEDWDHVSCRVLGLPGGKQLHLDDLSVRVADRRYLVSKRLGVQPELQDLDGLAMLRGFLTDTLTYQANIDSFMSRVAAPLDGNVTSHVFQLLVGPAGTGKSTLVNTLAYVFGDYCANIDSSVLWPEKGRMPTHFAAQTAVEALRGAKLVRASDSGTRVGDVQGELFNNLVGEDIISGRAGNAMVDVPRTFGMVGSANVPPPIHSSDISRRLAIYGTPSPRSIDGADPGLPKADPNLPDLLKHHGGAWLAELLRYVQLVRQHGLPDLPDVVRPDATGISERSPIRQFLDERCVRDPQGAIDRHLFADHFNHWLTSDKHDPEAAVWTLAAVTKGLAAEGIKAAKRGRRGQRIWLYLGIELRP